MLLQELRQLSILSRQKNRNIAMSKFTWSGKIISVQPRIRLLRSFDESSHNYLGYCLIIRGSIGDDSCEFSIGIGKAAYQKHQFQVGDEISGESLPVADPKIEPVEYYKTSKLKILSKAIGDVQKLLPSFHGIAPALEVYRERGHRRLSARTYNSNCSSCIWGCRMPVEMIIDHWNPRLKKYRYETFCYGPKSCEFYSSGPTRKVPGRKGMSWEEPDWVDEEATAHRTENE